MNEKYYISTGAQNHFYTLRHSWVELVYFRTEGGGTDSRAVERDYHIQNLSIDPVEAVRRAQELKPGLSFSTDAIVNPIGERRDIDWSIFQAGKYAGKSIHEVREVDPGYLIWTCENLGKSKVYAGTVELAKALMAHELAARAEARDEVAAAEEDARIARVERQAAVADVLAGCSRQPADFCACIAKDLRNGRQLEGRALDIAINIFAKAHGRSGSKKYDAALEVAVAALNPEALL